MEPRGSALLPNRNWRARRMGPRGSAPLPNRNWRVGDGAARERALAKPELACGGWGRAGAPPCQTGIGVVWMGPRGLAKPELLNRSANLSPHAFNLVAGHEMPDGGFAAWREGVAA